MRSQAAIDALSALAHAHRLGIYRLLVEAGPEGLPAGRIGLRLRVPPSSLTFHLQHLQRAGLVTQRRASRQLIYAADFDTMSALVGFLTENCCAGSSSASQCAIECATSVRPATGSRAARAGKLRRSA